MPRLEWDSVPVNSGSTLKFRVKWMKVALLPNWLALSTRIRLGRPVHTLAQQCMKASHMYFQLTLGKYRAAENRVASSTMCSMGSWLSYVISIITRPLNRTFSEPIHTRKRLGAYRICCHGTKRFEMSSKMVRVCGLTCSVRALVVSLKSLSADRWNNCRRSLSSWMCVKCVLVERDERWNEQLGRTIHQNKPSDHLKG